MCVLVCVRVYDSTYRDEISFSTLLCDVILVTPNNQLV